MQVRESLWRDDGVSYLRPLPGAIGVSSRSCSRLLQRAVSDFGMESSFQQSQRRVKEHYGFDLPLSAVADVTRNSAQAIAMEQQGREGANRLPAQGAQQLVAEADGSFLRIVSTSPAKGDRRKSRQVAYREVRLCAASAQGSARICYDASFGEVDTMAALWSFTAKEAGMSVESKVHIVSDGAAWINTQGRIAFGSQGCHLIDLYHVLQYLNKAAPACGEHPKRWLNNQKRRLKSGKAQKVIAELQKHLEPDALSDEESPVRCALRYLDNRRDHLAYDQAIAQELPVGSGLIESGNKHVLQARMKIPGASWNIRTAENFARTRAFRANGAWDSFWRDTSNKAA